MPHFRCICLCTSRVAQVRCIELHTIVAGGGLIDPTHRDSGSTLTLAALLSEPSDKVGGDFVAYNNGAPVVHALARGDAVLFMSEKIHNVSRVDRGVRQSLVVELWAGDTNVVDRRK